MTPRPRRRKRVESLVRDDTTGKVTVRPRKKLLERMPATKGPHSALCDIQEKLAAATEFYEHLGDGGRYGVYRAIIDVVDYFASQGIPRAALMPLSAVSGAIVDADRGTGSAIFKPDRGAKGGKPPASAYQLNYEGYLAAVTECCVRHYKAQGARPYVEPATRKAAQLIRDSRWPTQPTAKELREIRERVQQSERLSPDRLQFNELLDSEFAKLDPLGWAKRLLAHEWVIAPPA